MAPDEIDALVEAVIALRMNAQTKEYGPTVKAVQKLNISITYKLLDPRRMRKKVISCLIGREINSTKTLSAGEVGCLIDAIENQIPTGTLQKLELVVGNYLGSFVIVKPEDILAWNADHSGLVQDIVREYWPLELPEPTWDSLGAGFIEKEPDHSEGE